MKEPQSPNQSSGYVSFPDSGNTPAPKKSRSRLAKQQTDYSNILGKLFEYEEAREQEPLYKNRFHQVFSCVFSLFNTRYSRSNKIGASQKLGKYLRGEKPVWTKAEKGALLQGSLFQKIKAATHGKRVLAKIRAFNTNQR